MRRAWLVALPALAVMAPALASAEAVVLSPAPSRGPRPPVKIKPPPLRFKHPPPPFRQRQQQAVLVETSTHEVAIDRLPAASLLPPPVPGAPSPPAPDAGARQESTALRLVDTAAKATVLVPNTVTPRGEISDPWTGHRVAASPGSPIVRIEAVGGGVAALSWDQNSTAQDTLSARCDAPRPNAKPAALRMIEWRQLQLRVDGTFALREGTAWFDRTSCKLFDGAMHESPLKVVAAIEGRPVALAALAGTDVVLVTPPLGDVQQDGGGTKSHPFSTESGAVMVTRVKPVRGGSLSLSASLAPFSWQQWRTKLGDSSTVNMSLPSTMIRFDLSQSVSEPAPLALLTVQRPVGVREQTAPVPVLGAFSTKSESQRRLDIIADPF